MTKLLSPRALLERWRYIHTHFGIGYRFAPEPAVDAAAPAGAGAALVHA